MAFIQVPTFYSAILTFYLASFLASIIVFCLAFAPTFYLIFFLALYLTCRSGILTGIYSDSLSDMRAAGPQPRALDLSGQCPLTSGACGLSPAVPTEVWSLQLKCGSATWDLELAVEVLECTRLRSGCPTRVWSSQSRSTG